MFLDELRTEFMEKSGRNSERNFRRDPWRKSERKSLEALPPLDELQEDVTENLQTEFLEERGAKFLEA